MLNNMQRTIVFSHLPSGYEAADPNDTWLLALADKSNAHYLVTGDKKAGILSLIAVGQIKITKLIDYFSGHEQMDRAYGWGLNYVAGSK